jgi:hypothetical protein
MKIARNLLAILAVTAIATHVSYATVTAAPEIDASMGAGTLALLSGAVLILRGRSKR